MNLSENQSFSDPELATATVGDDGMFKLSTREVLTFKELQTTRVPIERTRQRYVQTEDGLKLITETYIDEREVVYEVLRYRTEHRTRTYTPEYVIGFDKQGNLLDQATLTERLAEDSPVVITRDNNVLDPKYVGLLSDEAIMLVINVIPVSRDLLVEPVSAVE